MGVALFDGDEISMPAIAPISASTLAPVFGPADDLPRPFDVVGVRKVRTAEHHARIYPALMAWDGCGIFAVVEMETRDFSARGHARHGDEVVHAGVGDGAFRRLQDDGERIFSAARITAWMASVVDVERRTAYPALAGRDQEAF